MLFREITKEQEEALRRQYTPGLAADPPGQPPGGADPKGAKAAGPKGAKAGGPQQPGVQLFFLDHGLCLARALRKFKASRAAANLTRAPCPQVPRLDRARRARVRGGQKLQEPRRSRPSSPSQPPVIAAIANVAWGAVQLGQSQRR